jgi:hypothetical protein
VSSRDGAPKKDASDLHDGQKGRGLFGIACGNRTPALEMQEGILDQMAHLIQIGIIRPEGPTIAFRRNDRLHALALGAVENGLRIIRFVRQKRVGVEAFHQAYSLRAICHGTRCNKNSERQTIRIHGQMYFGIEPPFVRPIASLPTTAPAACG